jgi:hypothetical protein
LVEVLLREHDRRLSLFDEAVDLLLPVVLGVLVQVEVGGKSEDLLFQVEAAILDFLVYLIYHGFRELD